MFKKYLWILDRLYSTGGISYKDLVVEWEKSTQNNEKTTIPKRTFDEYRKAIEETFDVNISCDASNGYKYRIDDVEFLQKDYVKNWLLSSFSINNIIQESRKLKGRILFERIPSGNEYLMDIIGAMQDNTCIRLTYQSFHSSSPSVSLVEPYCVRVFKQRWYMVARSRKKEKICVYALDRMMRLEHTVEAFQMLDAFEASTYFQDCYGIIVMPEELDVETIRIKISDMNHKRQYFRLLPIHPSQKEVELQLEYSIFEYRLYPTYDFFQEIMSHGSEIEVLAPDWVRKECRSIIQDMYQLYEED